MERLVDGLSAGVLHALGWALIHSVWECLGVAALAAILMGFFRRPTIRYLVGVVALAAMLALPVATFLLLNKPASPALALASDPAFAVSASADLSAPVLSGGGTVIARAAPVAAKTGPARAAGFLAPDILPALVAAWLCGVAFFSLRFAGGFLLLEQRRRRQSCPPDSRILALCHALQDQLGLTRAIRYLACDWIASPGVIGWLRPVVLLPLFALTGLTETQLKAVIAHELAHIRRHDFLVNLLQVLVETLLFYHPAVWWLNRRIRAERELCCDEIAVALTGDRLEYARVLTLMADWDRVPVLAMAANRGPLSARIFHVLGQGRGGRRTPGLTGSVLFLAAAFIAAYAVFGIAHPPVPAQVRGKAPSPPRLVAAVAVPPPVLPDIVAAASPALRDERAAPVREKPAARPAEPAAILAVSLPDLSRFLLAVPAMARLPAASDPVPVAHANAPGRAVPVITLSVPLKPLAGSNLRTVPVTINAVTKQFLLDIGTRQSEISQAAAADLGLPGADGPFGANQGTLADIDYARVPIFNVGGTHSADDYRPHVRAAAFTIGGVTGHNLALAVASDREMGRTKPYDGVMTGGLFGQNDVELDFAQDRLNYLKPTTSTDPDQVAYWPHTSAATIPMTRLNGKIQIQISIQGQSIPAVIDTASAHTVMRRDVAEMLFGFQADTPDMMPDGTLKDGIGLQVYRHTFPRISLSQNVTALNVPVRIQTSAMARNPDRTPMLGSRAQFTADPRQRIPALTLGMDVLSQLHLYAAFGQGMLYVTSAVPSDVLL